MMRELAQYWASDHDWSKCEAKLNGLPNFITEIDGLDIHFIHVRSQHEDALPMIVTHGWPGSIIEQLKIIEPLTNPTAHGASASRQGRPLRRLGATPTLLRGNARLVQITAHIAVAVLAVANTARPAGL